MNHNVVYLVIGVLALVLSYWAIKSTKSARGLWHRGREERDIHRSEIAHAIIPGRCPG
jgi:hypothetical protein